MKTEKNKLLIQRIESSINNRPDNFYYSNRTFRFIIWSCIILLTLLFLNLIIQGFSSYINGGYKNLDLLKLIVNAASLIVFTGYFFIRTLDSPKEKLKKDKWLWEKGRLLVTGHTLYPILLGVALIMNFVDFTNSDLVSQPILSLIIIGLFSTSMYGMVIFFIILYPKKIFSSKINTFGVAAYLMQFFVLGLILYNMYSQKLISGLVFFFILTIDMLLIYRHGKYLFYRNSLALTQKNALEIISPITLSKLITSKNKELNLRIKAIKYIEIKYNKNQYAYLGILNEELLREINSQSKSKYTWLLSIAWGLILYAAGSIGEGLLQDKFNNPIKKLLCEYLNIYCS